MKSWIIVWKRCVYGDMTEPSGQSTFHCLSTVHVPHYYYYYYYYVRKNLLARTLSAPRYICRTDLASFAKPHFCIVPQECPTLLYQGTNNPYYALAARVKVTVSGTQNHINFCA